EMGEVHADRFSFFPAARLDDRRHRAGVGVFSVDVETVRGATEADGSRSLPDRRSDLIERLEESSPAEADLARRLLRKDLFPTRELLRLEPRTDLELTDPEDRLVLEEAGLDIRCLCGLSDSQSIHSTGTSRLSSASSWLFGGGVFPDWSFGLGLG